MKNCIYALLGRCSIVSALYMLFYSTFVLVNVLAEASHMEFIDSGALPIGLEKLVYPSALISSISYIVPAGLAYGCSYVFKKCDLHVCLLSIVIFFADIMVHILATVFMKITHHLAIYPGSPYTTVGIVLNLVLLFFSTSVAVVTFLSKRESQEASPIKVNWLTAGGGLCLIVAIMFSVWAIGLNSRIDPEGIPDLKLFYLSIDLIVVFVILGGILIVLRYSLSDGSKSAS